MIPYDLDPSLHSGDFAPPLLDDGFSPPATREPAVGVPAAEQDDEDVALAAQGH